MDMLQKTKNKINEIEGTLVYYNKYFNDLKVEKTSEKENALIIITFKNCFITLVDDDVLKVLNLILIAYFNALENQRDFKLI